MFAKFGLRTARAGKVELTSRLGEDYVIRMPKPSPGYRSSFVFSYWKSGSTLLDSMLTDYCDGVGIASFSLFEQAFRQGVTTSDLMDDALKCLPDAGFVFTGFRHFPHFDLRIEPAQPVVLLVRDPRDMLVSMYFSVRNSHQIPRGQAELKLARESSRQDAIDQWVVKNFSQYMHSFQMYNKNLSDLPVRIFRYEDVIYAKAEWLREVVLALNLPLDEAAVDQIANSHDYVPSVENPNKHVRRVHPGDHKNKLADHTIAQLNTRFAPMLSAYGYQR